MGYIVELSSFLLVPLVPGHLLSPQREGLGSVMPLLPSPPYDLLPTAYCLLLPTAYYLLPLFSSVLSYVSSRIHLPSHHQPLGPHC